MLSQPNVRMVVFVMLMAIIVAVAGSLFFSLGSGQVDETATQAPPVEIDGVLLRITGDPAQRVSFAGADRNLQNVVTIPQPAPEQPTAVPAEGQSQEPAPTAVPPTLTPIPQAIVPQQAAVDPIIFINYTVQGSDTLYSVSSSRMDTSIALMSRFNISAEDLVGGSVIQLPVGNPAYCPNSRPYAVGEGDTAFSVARRFGTTTDTLKAMNNLDANYTIRLAEIICVP